MNISASDDVLCACAGIMCIRGAVKLQHLDTKSDLLFSNDDLSAERSSFFRQAQVATFGQARVL